MADSIREALTKAIDEGAKDESKPLEPVSNAAPDDSAPDSSPSSDGIPNESTDEGAAPDAADSASATAKPAEPAPAAAQETPPPASWSKEEREAWSTVPESARKAVARRESEMQRAFQSSATARRRVEALDNISAQYKPLMDKYGVTLETAMPSLLATRAVLEVGTPQQKAMVLANMCADFGVQVDILDAALAARLSRNPGPTQPPVQHDFTNDPKLAPLYAIANEINERRTVAAQAEIARVSALPHYEEVRFTMADLVDRAREAGKDLPLDKAHGLACQMLGFEVPVAPAKAPTVSEAAAILARSRGAAVSVSGAPQPSPARKPGEGTLRDELLANLSARR